MSEIDRLEVGIQSDATGAIRNLDNLVNKLSTLEKTMLKFNNINLNPLSNATDRFAKTLKKLSVNSSDISKITKQVNKLGEMKSGNLFNVAAALDKFTGAMTKFQTVNVDPNSIANTAQALCSFSSTKFGCSAENISKLANGLQEFSNKTQGFTLPSFEEFLNLTSAIRSIGGVETGRAILNLPNLSKSLTQLSSSLQGTNFNYDFKGLASLGESLRKLGSTTVTTATSNIPFIADGLRKLSKELAGISAIKPIQGLEEFAKSISMLGRNTTTQALNNIPELTNKLKTLVENLNKLPSINANATRTINQLYKLGEAFRNVGRATYSASNQAQNSTKGFKALSLSIGTLYAKIWALRRAFSLFGNAVEKSMDYIETLNYFNVAFEQVGKDNLDGWAKNGEQSAEEYVKSFSTRAKQLTKKMTGFEISDDGTLVESFNKDGSRTKSLGLDPEEIMNYQATFAQMTNSANLTARSVMNISDAMTMLGTDWSSLKNIGMKESMQKFVSGLAGQTMPVRELGMDITQLTLKQIALNYGIKDNIRDMSNAGKMQLRSLAMLQQSKVAMGDLAKTMNSPSNQLRVLRQNFKLLAQSIGNLFMPIVAKVLPYINGLVIAIRRLFTWIGSLLGIKLSDYDGGIGKSDIGVEIEDTNDGLDKANEKAEKLKRTLFSFDKANILQSNNKDNNKDKNSGIGDSGYAVLDDAIEKELEAYRKKWNKALQDMDDKAGRIADKICLAFQRIYRYAEPTRKSIKKLWDEGLSKLAKFNYNNLKNFWNNFLVPLGKWSLGTGFPRFFDITNSMLNNVNWTRLTTSLSKMYTALEGMAELTFSVLLDAYENFFAPLGTWTMSEAVPQLADIVTEFCNEVKWGKIRDGLNGIWKALQPIIKAIGQGFIDYLRTMKNILVFLANNVLPPILKLIKDILKVLPTKSVESLTKNLLLLATAMKGIKLGKKAIDGIKALSGLKGLNFAKNISVNMKGNALSQSKTLLNRLNSIGKIAKAGIAIAITIKSVEWGIGKSEKAMKEAGDIDSLKEGLEMMFNEKFGENMFSEGLSSWFTGAISLFDELGKTLKGETKLDDWEYAFKEFGKKIGKWIVDGCKSVMDGIAPQSFVDSVFEKMQSDSGKDGKKPNAVQNSVLENAPGNKNKKKEDTKKKVDNALSTIPNPLPNVKADVDTSSYEKVGKDMQTSIKKGWNDNKQSFNKWINDRPMAVRKQFGTIDLSSRGKGMQKSIKSGWKNGVPSLNSWLSGRPPAIKKSFGSVDMSSKGKGMGKTLKSGWKKNKPNMHSEGKSLMSSFSKGFKTIKLPKIKLEVKYTTSGLLGKIGKAIGLKGFPKLNFKMYANGGFPTKGDFFLANEAGPELVGTMGGRTAVANNSQITAGIAAAVEPAVYNGIVKGIRASNSGRKGSKGISAVYLDGKQVGRAVIDNINETTRMTGSCPLAIE